MPRTPRNIDVTQVSEWDDGDVRRVSDYLVGEEPLEIRLGDQPLTVTMRTPGHDLELATGFLLTEGLVPSANDILSIEYMASSRDARKGVSPAQQDGAGNVVRAVIAGGPFDRERMQRNFFASSSCGVCGKATIESVRVRGIRPPDPEFRLDPQVLCWLPDRLRGEQAIFGRTGGLHAAGLFTAEGELLVLREDVGRHNAVDKVVGWAAMRDRLPLSGCVLLVSGRGGFEIVQKALVAGLPVLASVSAPSGLAVRLARELGMTLVGFLRGRRFVIYSGEERVLSPSVVASE